jgi:hypothetical protein
MNGIGGALGQRGSTVRTATAICRRSSRDREKPRTWLRWDLRQPPPRDEERICYDVLDICGLDQSSSETSHAVVMSSKDETKQLLVRLSSAIGIHRVKSVRCRAEVLHQHRRVLPYLPGGRACARLTARGSVSAPREN